jgi:hypothetical protein
MEYPENLHLTVGSSPMLDTAVAEWLAARGEYKKRASHENQRAYNAAYFALGALWAERHPEAANSPDAFESFRRSLIRPGEE